MRQTAALLKIHKALQSFPCPEDVIHSIGSSCGGDSQGKGSLSVLKLIVLFPLQFVAHSPDLDRTVIVKVIVS